MATWVEKATSVAKTNGSKAFEYAKANKLKTGLIVGGTLLAAHVVTTAFRGPKEQSVDQQRLMAQGQGRGV